MKALYQAVQNRLNYIEQLCLLKAFKNILTVEIRKHEQKHRQLARIERTALNGFTMSSKPEDTLRQSFHIYSLKIFAKWDSGFHRQCFRKGKLSEIIDNYIDFFEFIGDYNVSRHIRQVCLYFSNIHMSTLFFLSDLLITVLNKKTEGLLKGIKGLNLSPSPTRKSSEIGRAHTTPSFEAHNDLSIISSGMRTQNARQNTLLTTLRERMRKNTQPSRVQTASRMQRRQTSAEQIQHSQQQVSEITKKLKISGNAVTPPNVLDQFREYFSLQFSSVLSQLPKQLNLQDHIQQNDQKQLKTKGLWLRKNYEQLFYYQLSLNTNVRNTIQLYKKQYRYKLVSRSQMNHKFSHLAS